MDLNELVDALPEEEKEIYLHASASEYFTYLEQDETFHAIVEKAGNSKLEEEEWKFILTKIYLVSCRALVEEGKNGLIEKLLYLFARVGQSISKKNGPFYVECYRMIEFYTSIQKEKEINKDVFEGLDIVMDSQQETDLDILLRQCQEASVFRKNQDGFMEAYHDSEKGVMSTSERMYIRAYQGAYEREKELIKKYEQK